MKHLFTFILIVAFTLTNAQTKRNFNVFKKSDKGGNNERIALVIANSNYDIGKLEKPVTEAKYLVEALEEQGYDVEVGYNLDQATMRKIIIEFSKKFGSYKSCIVYYAGHGFQIEGKNYLVPIDTPQANSPFELKDALLEVNYILEAINDPNKSKIIILDACRNNPFKENIASSYRGLDDDGFSKIKAQINSEIIFSTGPGMKVNDDNPFTKILSEEIKNGGCYDDIKRKLNKRVREANSRQIVTTMGFLEEEICFGTEKPVVIANNENPNNQSHNDNKNDVKRDYTDELIETLEWLKGKLVDIKYDKYFRTGALSHNYSVSYSYKLEYNVNTCTLKFIENYSFIEDRNSIRNDRKEENTYELKLSDISSIEVVYDSFVIKTINNKKAIHKKGRYEYELDEFTIKYDELGDLKDHPERFVKAFTDAVNMCGGGKKEKY